jgi:hypothetical protein
MEDWNVVPVQSGTKEIGGHNAYTLLRVKSRTLEQGSFFYHKSYSDPLRWKQPG